MREVWPQGFPATAQFGSGIGQLRMTIAVGDQRSKQFNLLLCLKYRLVGTIEIIKMTDQRIDTWRDVEGFEHMVAHKLGQIAHGLHRHGLLKQIQCLFVVDAEAAAKPGTIGRKAVEHINTIAAQTLAQRGDLRSEAREISSDRQFTFSTDMETCRLALCVLDPEYLRQGNGLVVTGVVKNAKDYRIAVVITQGYRPRGATDFVTLRFVITQHVGLERALLAARTRRLVVSDTMGWCQQRRHGINQR